MTTPFLLGDLAHDEGWSAQAYPDPKSGGEPWTIGFGHTGQVRGQAVAKGMIIDGDTGWALLHADAGNAAAECLYQFTWFKGLDDVRADVMVNACFNLGMVTLLTFDHFLRFMGEGDFNAAASDLQATKWARELPTRVDRLVAELRTGTRIPVAPPLEAPQQEQAA
jgi:lysozyme